MFSSFSVYDRFINIYQITKLTVSVISKIDSGLLHKAVAKLPKQNPALFIIYYPFSFLDKIIGPVHNIIIL